MEGKMGRKHQIADPQLSKLAKKDPRIRTLLKESSKNDGGFGSTMNLNSEPQEARQSLSEYETAIKANGADHRLENLYEEMKSSKTHRHSSFSGFFRKTNSAEYNAVTDSLGDVLEKTKSNFNYFSNDNMRTLRAASNAYFRLIEACNTYLEKDGGTTSSGAQRKARVKQIRKLAKGDVTAVQQYYHDIRFGKLSGDEQEKLTWKDILYSGREATIEVDDLHNDQRFKALGDGIKVGEKAGRKLESGVFVKKDVIDKINIKDGISPAFNVPEKDIVQGDYGKKDNITNRNVATSRMAGLLGLSGIVEESKTVKVKDTSTGKTYKGNLMSFAKGEGADHASKALDKKAKEDNEKLGGKRIETVEDRMKKITAVLAPSLQKEMTSLQVLDYICGQGDRKLGNYFVEKEGDKYAHVHGIDNDMSFGTGIDLAAEIEDSRGFGIDAGMQKILPVVGLKGELTIPYMDKQLAKNIVDLSADEVRFALKDLLAPQFIENTVARLKMVQDAIKKEEQGFDSPRFREDNEWDDTTAEDMVKKSGDWKLAHGLAKKNGGMDTYGESTYFARFVVDSMGFDYNKKAFGSELKEDPRKKGLFKEGYQGPKFGQKKQDD